jgi:hypothetical protein
VKYYLERNPQGFRVSDAGSPPWDIATSNSRTGFGTTRRLIYPKGPTSCIILHMIRMMMHDKRTGDQRFKETMQDFVKTYTGKAAATKDFKAAVEKHMTVEMDLEGNHRMDWFLTGMCTELNYRRTRWTHRSTLERTAM